MKGTEARMGDADHSRLATPGWGEGTRRSFTTRGGAAREDTAPDVSCS